MCNDADDPQNPGDDEESPDRRDDILDDTDPDIQPDDDPDSVLK